MLVDVEPKKMRLFPIFVREGRSRKRFKAGYIDSGGNVVVPPTYEYAHRFRYGYGTVRQGGLCGVVDLSG